MGSPVDPGKTVIRPMLRVRRRNRIDVAVLTHPHPDHFTGLASALAGVEVGQFWDTGQGEPMNAGPVYSGLLGMLRDRGVPILRPPSLCNRPIRMGGAELRVLAPCPDLTPYASPNDNSLVIHIRYGRHAVLLTGDAEIDEEQRLLRNGPERLRADVLKNGHHGSRTSSSEAMLDAVKPRIAILSCGVRNRFGHPHASTLSALATRSIWTLRTDRVGAVVWQTDGQSDSIHAVVGIP